MVGEKVKSYLVEFENLLVEFVKVNIIIEIEDRILKDFNIVIYIVCEISESIREFEV